MLADMVAVAVVIGIVSHSLVGVRAGLGIPVLAQRAVERRELIASRDEAQALLVEVQAGREAESEAAALPESGRIARDLHDVLAHSLAGLSVQLQATRADAAREHVDPAVLEPLDKAATLARELPATRPAPPSPSHSATRRRRCRSASPTPDLR